MTASTAPGASTAPVASTAPGAPAAPATSTAPTPTPQPAPAVTIERVPHGTLLRAPAYELHVWDDRPAAVLRSPDGRVWSELSLLASAGALGGRDEAYAIAAPRIERAGGAADDGPERGVGVGVVRVLLEATSPVWARRTTVLECGPDELRLHVELEGEGLLDELVLLGGDAIGPTGATGAFRSSIRFPVVFVPTPTEPVQVVRDASASARIGVVGDADPGRLHGIFSPPPLCFALGRDVEATATGMPDGDWLGLSVADDVGRLGITGVSYDPLDGGFRLRLDYEGRTAVSGAWRSPDIVLRPAGSPAAAIADHRDDLVARGWASAGPRPAEHRADWHAEPIFCGWGAQCARAVRLALAGLGELTVPEGFLLPPGAEAAAEFSRQDLYDGWLERLAEHGVDPGTIVVDDRWQAEYGTNTVDTEKWPDLAGWIRGQHARGRRVLLWLKAWDPGGLNPALCIRDRAGAPVAADPGSDAYLELLAARVHELLSPDGLDADGFKVDFTQRAPSGRTLVPADGSGADGGGVWGIAALHRMLGTIHDAAKRAKPDALVVTHAVHPSFGDVADMIRLNDVLRFDTAGDRVPVEEQLAFRHAVAHAALPDHPVDTDQWPMPDRGGWLAYARAQGRLGVPALYYVDSIDNSNEPVEDADLDEIADLWAGYRERIRRPATRGSAA